MKRVKSYNEFIAESSNKNVDEGITDIKGIASNPIKWKKIKNNAKKYQQTKVQIALNNVDHAKKTQASSGKMDPKQKETLKAANAAKNQALKDKASAVSQRMKDLATTDPLKQVVTIATTKANLAAAETALKAADGEESKQLKIRIKKLAGKASDAQQALKDYESEGGEKKEVELPGEKEAAAKAEKEKLDKEKAEKEKKAVEAEVEKAKAAYDKVKDGEDEKAKLQAEIKFKQAQQKKAKLDGNDELFQGLGDDIGEIMKKINALDPAGNTETETETETETGKDDPGAKLEADIKAFNDNIEAERTTMNKATKDLEQAKRDLKTGRGSEEKVQKLQKAIEDSKEDIAELKKKEADAKKKLAALSKPTGESFQPLEESVSEKFRRLMNNV
jgi:hypothetical protein